MIVVSPSRPQSGFTLVELLVVIGIIALLISILLPSLAKARQASQSLVCQSNLKTLVLAGRMYCDDNRGYWPMDKWFIPNLHNDASVTISGTKHFKGGIVRYLGRRDTDPRQPIPALTCPVSATAYPTYTEQRTYSMNTFTTTPFTGVTGGPVKIYNVKQPAHTMFFMGGLPKYIAASNQFGYEAYYDVGHLIGALSHVHNRTDKPSPNDYSNVGYVGGNVGRLTRAEATAIWGDGPGGNPGDYKDHPFLRGNR